MAKVDTARAAGGGAPYDEGATVQPTCDEYGRMVVVIAGGGGGGGGGSATLAEQEAQTAILADQLATLTGLSTETTSALIKTAIETNGGKLDTLHTDLAALLTEATGSAILSQLQDTGASVDSILSDTTGILTALGPLATGVDVGAVEDAVLAGNADLSTVAATIASQATAAKQDALKAVADAMAASLSTLVSQTDELEPDVDATRIATQASAVSLASVDAKTPALVGGRVPVDGSGVTQPVSGTVTETNSAATLAAIDGLEALIAATNTLLTNGARVTFHRAHLGAFGELIAQPLSFISQISFTYGINAVQGTAAASGTGAAVDTLSGALRIQSGTGSSGNASYFSASPLLYRCGQGMGMIWAQAFPTGVANNTTIGGPSTTDQNADGYFFGNKGTSFGIHHYRSGSEVSFIPQASWNGTVPAGFDPTKLTPWNIRYPFLGAGNIFFMAQDQTSGDFYVVHTIRYAGSSTLLQVSNPTMKFLARSVNSGNTTNVTTLVGSIGKYVVGTRIFNGPPFAFNNQKAVSSGIETNIFSIRVATTLNGVTNRGAARVRLGTCVADNGNTITAFFASLGATVGGTPSFSPYNGSTSDNGVTLTNAHSMLSFDTAGTTASSSAIFRALNTGCARNSQVPLDLADFDIILLPGETWTISALPGANTNCAVFVNGLEEW